MTTATRRSSRLLAGLGVTALAAALGLVTAAPAYAATFVATDAASLSAAITAANGSAGVDTIEIQPAVGNTITMAGSNPQVTGPIIVTGDPLNPPTIIGPTAAAPIFQVVDPTANIEIDNVKMQGTATGGSAITFVSSSGNVTFTGDTFSNFVHPAVELLLHTGDLTVTNCTFSGNLSNAADGNGGAIVAGSVHDVTINGSTFTNNTAEHRGGALYLGDANSVNISQTTFSGNSAGDDGGAIEINTLAADSTWRGDAFTGNSAGGTASYGGAAFAVYTILTGVTFVIDQSTFTGNSTATGAFATRAAVGFLGTEEGTFQFTNSTMTGNSFTGGSNGTGIDLAIDTIGDLGEVDIVQSTLDEAGPASALLWVSGNEHLLRLASSTLIGPGVLHVGSNGNPAADAVEARDTIAISTSGAPAFDVVGTPAAISYSITSDAAGVQLVGGAGMQFSVADAHLGPLANNGGPTATRLPLVGSPAIDAGDPSFTTPLVDQRGAGFTRVVNGRVDIGAVEVQTTTAPTLSATGVDPASTVWTASTSLAAGLLLLGALLITRRARRNTAK